MQAVKLWGLHGLLWCGGCPGLAGGVFMYRRAFYVNSEQLRALEYGSRQTWFQILGAVAEISLCGAYVGCIGHGVFPAFGESENAVGQLLFLFVAKTVGRHDAEVEAVL